MDYSKEVMGLVQTSNTLLTEEAIEKRLGKSGLKRTLRTLVLRGYLVSVEASHGRIVYGPKNRKINCDAS